VRPSVQAAVAAVAAIAISTAGAATAEASAPSNDAFSAAAPLAVGQQISSDNLDATVEPGEPNAALVAVSGECAAFSDGPQCGASVWYAFTPASGGQYTIETCDRGTDMDTVLGVYTGATIGAAVLVGPPPAQNDDTPGCGGGFGDNGSQVTFTAAAGTTYHVDLTGFRGEMGSFYLRAYSGPAVARPVPDTAIPRDGSFLGATTTFGRASVLSGPRHTPSFPFISTPRGAAFECSLDGAAFTGCSSPMSFDGLASGDHTFAVRAIAGGAIDPTPVVERFAIGDTTPPETSPLVGPSGDTPSTSATWLTASNERNGSGSHFNCHFDGQAAINNCSHTATFSPLCMGAHTFDAAAWDRAINLDATPVTASINVTTGTACAPPTVAATATTATNPTAASISFPYDNKGAGATLRVEYGKTTSYGQELRPRFLTPSAPNSFTSFFQFLDPGTLYHYRVTISTPFGTQSTADQTFTTTALGATTLPAVQTDDPTAIGHLAARLPVKIDAAGMDTLYSAYVEPTGHPVTLDSPAISGDGIIPGTSTGPQAGSVSVVDLEPGKSFDYRIGAIHQGSDANGVLGPTRTLTVPDLPGPSGGSGGGGGGSAATTAVPVIGPTAGAASLAARTAKVTKGKVALRLRCSAAGPCAGSLEIDATGASAVRKKKKPTKTVVARGRYSLAAGTTATVTVPLNAKGRKLLRKHHGKLTTKLVLSPAGATATTSNLTLKQTATKRKKPKRRH
jgi:hypothetical protein